MFHPWDCRLLFALTKTDSEFEWSPSCQHTFERLKQLLASAPILIFPDFKKRFILETDTSGVGLGAVLSQKQTNKQITLIAYANWKLQHETRYGISELEALVVVWVIKHFITLVMVMCILTMRFYKLYWTPHTALVNWPGREWHSKRWIYTDVLYCLVSDSTLRVMPPVKYRCDIIKEADGGKLGWTFVRCKFLGR